MNDETIINLLKASFETFYQAAQPRHCLPAYLPAPPTKGRTIVLGAGKAAAAMAATLEQHYPAPCEGLVITRYGHNRPTKHIEVVEAAHPVPDAAGEKAVQRLEQLASEARPEDLVICLISGGGSALLSAPVAGVSLAAIQDVTSRLLASGAAIEEINCVRKHLNRLAGGGLSKLIPRTAALTLAISDVIGDDPSTIASGPTVPDPTYLDEAAAILKFYKIKAKPEINQAFENPLNETAKPGDPLFGLHEYRLIAAPETALKKVMSFWQDQGFEAILYNADLAGETNTAAAAKVEFLQRTIRERAEAGRASARPLAIISGGETTVKLNHPKQQRQGRGGPNTQFALAACIALEGAPGIYGLAADSDGFDGSGDNAGAFLGPETLKNAAGFSLDANAHLANNDSYSFFNRLNQLVSPGATDTNINDYRVFLHLGDQHTTSNTQG